MFTIVSLQKLEKGINRDNIIADQNLLKIIETQITIGNPLKIDLLNHKNRITAGQQKYEQTLIIANQTNPKKNNIYIYQIISLHTK